MRSEALVDRVRRLAGEIERSWPVQKPSFALLTGWSTTYDDILSGTFATTLHEDQILDRALTTGRAVLAGRAGTGKLGCFGACTREPWRAVRFQSLWT